MAAMKLLSLGATSLFAHLCEGFIGTSPRAFAPRNVATFKAIEGDSDFYIDRERRHLMNLIVVGSAAATTGGLAVPYLAFFVPPRSEGENGPVLAKDALGREIYEADYVASKSANDHSLVQGLKGDASYLIVNDDNKLQDYSLNAICTHLGCTVPWYETDNKFECPCHGSQYAPDGSVVRGPAPLPLALAHVKTNKEGKVVLDTWTETDFRTGKTGWWI